MLAASVAAQAGASVAINGPAFLIPTLQDDRGLSLAEAGTVAAAPIAGVMVTLFVWGLLVDRIGERAVLLAGLGGTALLGAVAAMVHDTITLVVLLFVVGMFAACTGSASGRIVVDTLVCGANAEGEGSAVAEAIAKNADSEGA